METKICNVCKEEKLISEYYFRKDIGTYKNRCKRCCIDGKNIVRSETHKVCKHCGEEKAFDQFQKGGGGKWLQPYCKPCDSVRKKKHHAANAEKIKLQRKEYYEQNKEEIAAREKAKRAAIIKKPRRVFKRMPEEERKRKKSLCDKLYRERNAEKIKEKKRAYYESGRATEMSREYARKKAATDIVYRIKRNLRTRIRCALKPTNAYKLDRSEALLGCTIEYYKQYLEGLFADGMTWEKFLAGEIWIDHIKPCKLFDLTKEEEQRACFFYKNTQPMWVIDNLKKGIKYES